MRYVRFVIDVAMTDRMLEGRGTLGGWVWSWLKDALDLGGYSRRHTRLIGAQEIYPEEFGKELGEFVMSVPTPLIGRPGLEPIEGDD